MYRMMARRLLILPCLYAASALAAGELIGGDMKFRGVVVAYPCSIAPGSEEVPVDFGKISIQSLYATGKSTPIPFSIKLQDCSSSVFNSVTVTFNGTPNTHMADRLAIVAKTPGNAGGVGIGLLEADDTPVKLGVPTSPTAIDDPVMQLNFQAFIEAEPNALAQGNITTGAFTATANYTLNYQ